MANDSESTKKVQKHLVIVVVVKNARNTEKLNCFKSSVYSSRCLCLRNNAACTSKCSCKHCDNHFGKVAQESNTVNAAHQKRPRHEEQKLARTTGVKFMKSTDEQLFAEKWTPIEHYVLLGILQYQIGQKECANFLLSRLSSNCTVMVLAV